MLISTHFICPRLRCPVSSVRKMVTAEAREDIENPLRVLWHDGEYRELTAAQDTLLFSDDAPEMYDWPDADRIFAVTTWEANRWDLVILRWDVNGDSDSDDHADEEDDDVWIGIFVGRSSGRKKPMFATFRPKERKKHFVNVLAGSGVKTEYDDYIESISLDILRSMPDAYFRKVFFQKLHRVVGKIEELYLAHRQRKRETAARRIQKFARELSARPTLPSGRPGSDYLRAVESFQDLAVGHD